jgi:flagellar basal-body rod protein FlgF
LQLDPEKPPPTINKSGTITQDGQDLGALGLYRFPQDAKLIRAEGSSVIADVAPTAELDFISNGIVQGFVEKSNVNPMLEMTNLITIQRKFEAVSAMMNDTQNSLQDALKTIAGS